MTDLKCLSCGSALLNTSGGVKFLCPNCKEGEIVRCGHCRIAGVKYRCTKCGFEGPN